MRAVKRGADLLFKDPVAAWKKYCDVKPAMKTRLSALQFERSFNYMSPDLANVQRDWNKVTAYSKRLGIVSEAFKPNMTNEFLQWTLEDQEKIDGNAKQVEISRAQHKVATQGGVLTQNLGVAERSVDVKA